MKHREQTQTMEIAGIPVEITRKHIRHAYLRVKRLTGTVALSVPWTMNNATISRLYRRKLIWIERQLAKPVPAAHTADRTFAGSDTMIVWGQAYRLELRTGTRYAIALSGDTAVMTAPKNSTADRCDAFVREWIRALLMAEAAPLLARWEAATGLKASGFRTRDMKTRWGTCNTKTGLLWFSLQLAKFPVECLNYVVLHELLHLAERSHGKRFYALLSHYMPDWKHWKSLLGGRQPRAED